MIVKTEAVVLRSINYRDKSKVVTLYTKAFGRMAVIAKGCRDAKSKFGSAFEPTSHIEAVLYKRDTRDLQNISDAQLLSGFSGLTSEMPRLAAALPILELVNLATEEEANPKLFFLLVEVLKKINAAKKNTINFFFFFQVRLIELLGFKPSFSECVITGKSILREIASGNETHLYLVAGQGGIALGSANLNGAFVGRRISIAAYRNLDMLAKMKLTDVETLFMSPVVSGEVAEILEAYLKHHIEDLPTLRSTHVLGQIL
jgi:DNA repair protein RecO (recombination protein O)